MITMNVSGNICADAIVSNVNGTDVLKFSVASNRRYKTKTGETREEVTYMYCVIWNKKDLAKLLFKGRAINVFGYFSVRNAVDKDGVMRPFYSLRVSSFEVFGKGRATEPAGQQPPQNNERQTQPVNQQAEHFNVEGSENEPPIHDDLPF